MTEPAADHVRTADRSWRARARRSALWIAGPLLIVAANLVVLHDFALMGTMSNQRVDVLRFWLPVHCFLGRTIASGELPAWNPHVMSGVPFAADPQSGWMYLPPMLLYGILDCRWGLAWFTVLQPIVGGLGWYWFLREEGLSRPSAATAGVVASLAVSASIVVLSFPYSGSIAWTGLLLGCASRCLRASAWSPRLAWAVGAAVAWGQLAGANLSHGLVMGTGVLAAYWAARGLVDVRRGARTPWVVLGTGAVLVVAFVAVNLAVLLPRLAYLPRTTLGLGYDGLEDLAASLSVDAGGLIRPWQSTGFSWPLRFATSPGAYLGAIPLALAPAGWWSPRHRYLVAAFSAFAAVTYLLALRPVAEALAPVIDSWPLADSYLHAPIRFVFGPFLALPVLAGLGLEAWREAPSKRNRVLMLLPGALLWGAGPFLVRVDRPRLALLAAGAAFGVPLLIGAARRPALLGLLPVLVAAELTVGGLVGQAAGARVDPAPGASRQGWEEPFGNLLEPGLAGGSYFQEGPIAGAMRAGGVGRYLSLDRAKPNAYVRRWTPADGGLLTYQRAMVLGLEDVQGLNPVQPLRYWTLARRVNPRPQQHNWAILGSPPAEALDLLHVRWIVSPATDPGAERLEPIAIEGPWALFERETPERATVHESWVVVADDRRALEAVLDPGPTRPVVLDRDPGIEPDPGGSAGGSARYEPVGTQGARVLVDAPAPAIVLVRNPFDPNWRATVDGRPAEVLRAGYLLQAVAVPAGRHVVDLRYDDPWIGIGLLGSGLAVVALLGTAGWLRWRAARDHGR